MKKNLILLHLLCFSAMLWGQEFSDTLRFGVMADCQYCDCDARPIRHYRNSTNKLAACVDQFNTEKLDFAVHLGDFIDTAFTSFDTLQPIIDKLNTKLYHVLGNHDFSVDASYKKKVPARMGLKKPYYSFLYGNWQFIVLDGNDLSLYAARTARKKRFSQDLYNSISEQKKENAQKWNGGLSKGQMNWLRKRLKKAQKEGRQVILFCHFPVYPANPHNLWNDSAVVETLEQYSNVRAYFNGHNHAGNYGIQKDIHYLTFKGMVDTPKDNAFGIVTLTKDSIIIRGYGREEDKVFSF